MNTNKLSVNDDHFDNVSVISFDGISVIANNDSHIDDTQLTLLRKKKYDRSLHKQDRARRKEIYYKKNTITNKTYKKQENDNTVEIKSLYSDNSSHWNTESLYSKQSLSTTTLQDQKSAIPKTIQTENRNPIENSPEFDSHTKERSPRLTKPTQLTNNYEHIFEQKTPDQISQLSEYKYSSDYKKKTENKPSPHPASTHSFSPNSVEADSNRYVSPISTKSSTTRTNIESGRSELYTLSTAHIESLISKTIQKTLDQVENKPAPRDTNMELDNYIEDDIQHRIQQLQTQGIQTSKDFDLHTASKRRKEMEHWRMKLSLEEKEIADNCSTFIEVGANVIEGLFDALNFKAFETHSLSTEMSRAIDSGRFSGCIRQYAATNTNNNWMKNPLMNFITTFCSVLLKNHLSQKKKEIVDTLTKKPNNFNKSDIQSVESPFAPSFVNKNTNPVQYPDISSNWKIPSNIQQTQPQYKMEQKPSPIKANQIPGNRTPNEAHTNLPSQINSSNPLLVHSAVNQYQNNSTGTLLSQKFDCNIDNRSDRNKFIGNTENQVINNQSDHDIFIKNGGHPVIETDKVQNDSCSRPIVAVKPIQNDMCNSVVEAKQIQSNNDTEIEYTTDPVTGQKRQCLKPGDDSFSILKMNPLLSKVHPIISKLQNNESTRQQIDVHTNSLVELNRPVSLF